MLWQNFVCKIKGICFRNEIINFVRFSDGWHNEFFEFVEFPQDSEAARNILIFKRKSYLRFKIMTPFSRKKFSNHL